MRKAFVEQLQPGDQIRAQVIDLVSATEMIVSVYGDLIRVRNESAQPFRRGDFTTLTVLFTNPLSFKLSSESAHAAHRRHLDRRA